MKKILKYIMIIIMVIGIIIIAINLYVKMSTKKQIISDYSNLKDTDCIIILGAGIWGDKPSPMLEDRLLEGINLYQNGASDKILMSGDHGRDEYDEVNIMKDYAIEKGIPSKSIFMDHAGFSTYESIYRAKEIFQAKKVVIVTQKYHLYRALYIAKNLGLEAYGVGADPRQYRGAFQREVREVIARDKDFIKCILKPKPTYLGEVIPISGNGDITNDEKESIKPNLFDRDEIIKVSINNYSQYQNIFEYTDKDTIDKVYNLFKDLKTNVASKSNEPENPEELYEITFFNDENMLIQSDNDIFKAIFYVYKKNNKYYAEEHKNGIYEITEDAFNVIKNLAK